MALKKNEESKSESLGGLKAKAVFGDVKETKEKKILTTFSIEPSFKDELEELFGNMGLGLAAGIRFALKEFAKKYGDEK